MITSVPSGGGFLNKAEGKKGRSFTHKPAGDNLLYLNLPELPTFAVGVLSDSEKLKDFKRKSSMISSFGSHIIETNEMKSSYWRSPPKIKGGPRGGTTTTAKTFASILRGGDASLEEGFNALLGRKINGMMSIIDRSPAFENGLAGLMKQAYVYESARLSPQKITPYVEDEKGFDQALFNTGQTFKAIKATRIVKGGIPFTTIRD